MALNYTTYVAQMANLMVYLSTEASFQTMLPGMIDYAEQRIYRELDLLDTKVTNASANLTPNQRTADLPTNTGNLSYVVVDSISVITPVTAGASNGVRQPLTPTSIDFINSIYPSAAQYTGTPTFFAMQDQDTIVLGPTPNSSYFFEVIGTVRPTPLSSSNANTFLTDNLPDLFVAASMVYGSGFMRDFGAQTDNAPQGNSWETQYKALFQSATVEEMRKKFYGPAWTSISPAPLANPGRV